MKNTRPRSAIGGLGSDSRLPYCPCVSNPYCQLRAVFLNIEPQILHWRLETLLMLRSVLLLFRLIDSRSTMTLLSVQSQLRGLPEILVAVSFHKSCQPRYVSTIIGELRIEFSVSWTIDLHESWRAIHITFISIVESASVRKVMRGIAEQTYLNPFC